MRSKYRSWEERRQIIKAIIASTEQKSLSSFSLTESEEIFFRAKTERMISGLARSTSDFRAYYNLPTDKPFGYVLGIVGLMITGAASGGVYIWLHSLDRTKSYPLFAALAATAVAAIGWGVAGWISHRNTTRQNTNNMLFARFSQAPFGEALHRFHARFGYDKAIVITKTVMDALRSSKDDNDLKAAAAVSYILNYYEFLSAGVLKGDLDRKILENNLKGTLSYYYDKCAPHIHVLNKVNPKAYENLMKLRTHYREP